MRSAPVVKKDDLGTFDGPGIRQVAGLGVETRAVIRAGFFDAVVTFVRSSRTGASFAVDEEFAELPFPRSDVRDCRFPEFSLAIPAADLLPATDDCRFRSMKLQI